MSRVTVIDYGLGNLHSVVTALAHVGAAVEVAESGDELTTADWLVLPGVGAFADGMAGLKGRGHDQGIRDAVSRGARLLGICLGMQLLFDESEEFGCCQGLGLIPGRVTRIPPVGVKVPHVGWNRLQPLPGRSWTGTPLALIPPGTWAYFVHSFRVEVSDEANLLAVAQYGPHHVTAAVGRGSVHGFQFHPEKSGRAGLDMLQAFCSQKD